MISNSFLPLTPAASRSSVPALSPSSFIPLTPAASRSSVPALLLSRNSCPSRSFAVAPPLEPHLVHPMQRHSLFVKYRSPRRSRLKFFGCYVFVWRGRLEGGVNVVVPRNCSGNTNDIVCEKLNPVVIQEYTNQSPQFVRYT
jgi:hypothetical protein